MSQSKINPTTTDQMLAAAPNMPLPSHGKPIAFLGEAATEHPDNWLKGHIHQAQSAPSSAKPTVIDNIPHTAEHPAFHPKKAAIIGTAPSSRLLAPFGDPSWTIWGSSPGNAGALPRTDAWFEIHNNFLFPEYVSYGGPYVKWLNEQTMPVMAHDLEMFPKAVLFPKNELINEFGPYFFTSTFAWMAAYAIYAGCEEIGFYGVDMASKDEYIKQRAGGQYFISIALKRGIKITVPKESDLLQPPPLYGFCDSSRFGRKIAARELEVKQRVAEMSAQRDQLNNGITYLNGALEDIDYMRQIWGGLEE